MDKKRLQSRLEGIHLPCHIGVIMDGNGRWAASRKFPRNVGHRQGAKAFERLCRCCRDIGIEFLTVYAFSTENWKRPPDEVESIFALLRTYLRDAVKHKDENIRIRFIGDLAPLSEDLKELMRQAEEGSRNYGALTVNVALNYGGRDELVHCVREIAGLVKLGRIEPKDIGEDMIGRFLYTAGQPDPDLIIRPSGEQRLSNFLLWQSAYAELVFMEVLWPDFNEEHLVEAIREYGLRNRRFGGINQ